MPKTYREALARDQKQRPSRGPAAVSDGGRSFELEDGAVVIAAITSCTNTSNPAVMIAAGLLARNARRRGLNVRPWVKTSLAPGSKVVTDYLVRAGLLEDLEALGFYVVGYGCTTCIGNSGPSNPPISEAIAANQLTVASVLSGNRNFEGRVHQEVRMNFLASPPLVVAYAIAGSVDLDLTRDPLGTGADGQPVHLRDVWPTQKEIQAAIHAAVSAELFAASYADVFKGDERWRAIEVTESRTYPWDDASTYIQNPPYFAGMRRELPGLPEIHGARCLAVFGDSITTDHISPAGSIRKDSPAGQYLLANGVQPADFNSYGSRRGNHEVMMRGTFANIRIRNRMTPDVEGGVTRLQPGGEQMSIYDAAMKYVAAGMPLVILAGREYGTGSSRDWAAKGTRLLGVRAVIAASFERIHRANLVGMGVFPLTFRDGQDAASLGLDGTEVFEFDGLADGAEKRTGAGHRPDGQVIASRSPFAWIRPRSGNTCSTAASCNTCCASSRISLAARPSGRAMTEPPAVASVRRIAVFDLDGTITRRDTLPPYLRGWLRGHPRRLRRLCGAAWPAAALRAGSGPRPAEVGAAPRRHGWSRALRGAAWSRRVRRRAGRAPAVARVRSPRSPATAPR